MNGRERVLTALRGNTPDRVPRALSFGRVDLERLLPPDEPRESFVDVDFILFPDRPQDQALRELLKAHRVDTRLGTPEQAANYAAWHYHPETPQRSSPLENISSLQGLLDFPFPQDGERPDVAEMARQVDEIHSRGLAAGSTLPHLGGELFEPAWRLRGLKALLLDFALRPECAHVLLRRLGEMAQAKARTVAEAGADVLSLGDDVGMPGRMIFSPEHWREFIKPQVTAIVTAAKSVKPDIHVIYHSDGHYEPIVGDLIEIGISAINPLQPEHMDARRIRRRFGTSIAFWGTVGSHNSFALATPELIRREVRLRVETLGRAALILCPAYGVGWPDTIPLANIRAFLDAADEFGG